LRKLHLGLNLHLLLALLLALCLRISVGEQRFLRKSLILSMRQGELMRPIVVNRINCYCCV
jgi:hypothetical protein